MSQEQSIILSYKYRLLPTKKQHAALNHILEQQRILYNAALEERIDCYRKTKKQRSLYDQQKALTEWRGFDPDARSIPVKIQRWTLVRLDDAYRGFFSRVKNRTKAGLPSFRGRDYWNTFGFVEFTKFQFNGTKIRFKSLPGSMRVKIHRPLPANYDVRTCSFTKDSKGWFVSFQIKLIAPTSGEVTRAVGLDVGLTSLATLSDGSSIPNLRHNMASEKHMRRLQRALRRCKKGSSGRKKARKNVAKLHRKIKDSRETYLHKISSKLVSENDLIAVEKLNIQDMTQTNRAKSIHDASWGKFIQKLAYKAAKAGRELVEVDPRNTSQACSGCGEVVKKALSVRVHDCPHCGLVLDRDHNAAINILNKAVAGLGLHNVGQWSERATGNIVCDEVTDETLPSRWSLPRSADKQNLCTTPSKHQALREIAA